MSVLLSIYEYRCFALTYGRNHAFEVGSFGDIQQDRVVFGLPPDFDEAQSTVSIQGGVGEHFQETRLVDVIGARAGDQNAAGAKHLEGAEVQFLVAAESRIEVALGFGEGGRVEHNRIVVVTCGGVILEQVEGVGLNPLDFAMIEGGVLVGDFEGRAGAVHPGDVRAARAKWSAKPP